MEVLRVDVWPKDRLIAIEEVSTMIDMEQEAGNNNGELQGWPSRVEQKLKKKSMVVELRFQWDLWYHVEIAWRETSISFHSVWTYLYTQRKNLFVSPKIGTG